MLLRLVAALVGIAVATLIAWTTIGIATTDLFGEDPPTPLTEVPLGLWTVDAAVAGSAGTFAAWFVVAAVEGTRRQSLRSPPR